MGASPMLGEVMMFGGNFAPRGWALCNGQLLSIAQNQALFALIGTTYGGDGQVTFALPDLRGRAPVHQGQGPGLNARTIGETFGSETVTLLASQMPVHNHLLIASKAASTNTGPTNNVTADSSAAGAKLYVNAVSPVGLTPNAVGSTGGIQPHENRMPYVAVNFCIALEGIFPSRN